MLEDELLESVSPAVPSDTLYIEETQRVCEKRVLLL